MDLLGQMIRTNFALKIVRKHQNGHYSKQIFKKIPEEHAPGPPRAVFVSHIASN